MISLAQGQKHVLSEGDIVIIGTRPFIFVKQVILDENDECGGETYPEIRIDKPNVHCKFVYLFVENKGGREQKAKAAF